MIKHSENTEPSNSTKPVLANRIFKLRAWVRNELMVNVVSIDFNNEFITWDDNQYDRCVPPNKCYEIETFDDIVLMQFTNFKDKKGIDIYEGDIIQDIRFKYKYIVVYEGNQYVAKSNTGSIGLFETEDRYKIIGNRFQNPELLQDVF